MTTERGGVHSYGGAKKVGGRKRHIFVDTLGLLLKAHVHAADIIDRDGALLLLRRLGGAFSRLRHIWADMGSRGRAVEWIKEQMGWTLEIVKQPSNWGHYRGCRPHPSPPHKPGSVCAARVRRPRFCGAEASASSTGIGPHLPAPLIATAMRLVDVMPFPAALVCSYVRFPSEWDEEFEPGHVVWATKSGNGLAYLLLYDEPGHDIAAYRLLCGGFDAPARPPAEDVPASEWFYMEGRTTQSASTRSSSPTASCSRCCGGRTRSRSGDSGGRRTRRGRSAGEVILIRTGEVLRDYNRRCLAVNSDSHSGVTVPVCFLIGPSDRRR